MFHTQAFWLRTLWLPLLHGSSPTTTTTAGRMQAEKHRESRGRRNQDSSAGVSCVASCARLDISRACSAFSKD